MSKRDEIIQSDPEFEDPGSNRRAKDDRRGEVKPTDNPVPSSPEAEPEAVREGEEKLDRVKPY